MAVAYHNETNVRCDEMLHLRYYRLIVFHFVLQITIGDQNVTANALQVVTLAVRYTISGITVTGSKPFVAFSGNMYGCGQVTDNADNGQNYAMVMHRYH